MQNQAVPDWDLLYGDRWMNDQPRHVLKPDSANKAKLPASSESLQAENRRILEAAFEAAAHATVIADANGTMVWVNAAFVRCTGYSVAEAIGQNTNLLKSGDQDVSYYKDLWQTITAGNTWHGTLINKRKDGSLYNERMAITPIHDGSGKISHYVAVKEDITESVRMQESLRSSSERYERLFENSPMALWEEDYSGVKIYLDNLKASGISDLGSWLKSHPEAVKKCAMLMRVVNVNKAVVTMFGGRDKNDFIGNLDTFFNDTSYKQLRKQLVWLAQGNLTYSADVQNVTANGDLIDLRLALSISPKFADCWSEVITSCEDISDRIQHEKQLAHAIKIEAVGQLTGGIAHDFNNVLTVINGNLQLILDMFGKDLGQDMIEMIDDSLSATDDGAELTSRLLAFSRRPEPENELLDINEHLEDFAILMRRTLGSGISVDTQLADNLAKVKTDKSALGNAYLNLALNSRDAMPEGGKLTFTSRKGVLDKSIGDGRLTTVLKPCVVIEIADTGCGMSPDVLAKATDPFFTTKALDDGTGLGLSMVYDFLRDCGGDLRISSSPGAGTKIEMYLPVVPTNER